MVLPTGFGKSRLLPDPVDDPAEAGGGDLAAARAAADQHEKLRRAGVPCVRSTAPCAARRARTALARDRARRPLLVMTTPETLGSPRRVGGARDGRHLAGRGRRGALHLGVGLRLPPRLPAARRAPARARRAADARAHGDRDREGARRDRALRSACAIRAWSRPRRTARTSPSRCCAASGARAARAGAPRAAPAAARASSTARPRARSTRSTPCCSASASRRTATTAR